jgi:hypothetical protein
MKKIILLIISCITFNVGAMYRPSINIALNPNCPPDKPFQYTEDGKFAKKRWPDGKENECLSCDSEDPFSFDFIPDSVREEMNKLCSNRIWDIARHEDSVNIVGFFRKKCPPSKPIFSPHGHRCKSCQEMFLEQKMVLYDISEEECHFCPNAIYYPEDGMAKCHFSDMRKMKTMQYKKD